MIPTANYSTIIDKKDFRLRLKKSRVLSPPTPNTSSIDFIREYLDDKGNVTETSTYNFFLTDDEIMILCHNLKR